MRINIFLKLCYIFVIGILFSWLTIFLYTFILLVINETTLSAQIKMPNRSYRVIGGNGAGEKHKLEVTAGQPIPPKPLSGENYVAYNDSSYVIKKSANSSPQLLASQGFHLNDILEDAIDNPGTIISGILVSIGKAGIFDVNDNEKVGIALTGVINVNGKWQYSINSGATWIDIIGISDSNAILLAADNNSTFIRFIPEPDYFGNNTQGLTFRAWDQSQNQINGTSGVSTVENGVDSPYSQDTAQITISVIGINDPPIANAGIDQNVNEGLKVVLDASNSSGIDDEIKSYEWLQLNGPDVLLSDYYAFNPSFIAPEINNNDILITFLLTVTDTFGMHAQDTVNIKILNQLKTFQIKAFTTGKGSVIPDGLNIKEGESQLFIIKPEQGFIVSNVIIDQISHGIIDYYIFENIDANHTINVIFEQKTYIINSIAGENGSINPGGNVIVNEGTNQEFIITPDRGFEIDTVLVNGNNIEPTDRYTFWYLSSDHEISVIFKKMILIKAVAVGNGSINPEDEIWVSKGQNQEFEFSSNDGYCIESVFVDDMNQDIFPYYRFNNLSTDHTIKVIFSECNYSIIATPGLYGYIDPAGLIELKNGEDQIFVFKPDNGYQVSDVIIDGESKGILSTYTFENISSDHTIAAKFEPLPVFEINAVSGKGGKIFPEGIKVLIKGSELNYIIEPEQGFQIEDLIIDHVSIGVRNQYTFREISSNHEIEVKFCQKPVIISYAAANGYINPSGQIQVDMGGYQIFNIVPYPGYRISDIIVDDVSKTIVNQYYFQNIHENHTIYASFESSSYTIYSHAEENGKIEPFGNVLVNEGEDQSFSIHPNFGFEIDRLIVNSKEIAPLENYTFFNVQEENEITALFKRKPVIIASSGINGKIEPSGQINIDMGGFQAFVISPDNGYGIEDVIIDDISHGPISGYIFWNIIENHTISVSFKKFKIKASSENYGAINPSGESLFSKGESQTYIFNPDSGYEVLDVLVDNISLGKLPLYTFWDISKDHTIHVSFKELENFIIRIKTNTGGEIAPNNAYNELKIQQGQYKIFIINPDEGYEVCDVLIDGYSIGPKDYYVFTNVNANHEIEARFNSIITYNLSASAENGGFITPTGMWQVRDGSYHIFDIKANDGYLIDNILVNGESKGSLSQFAMIANMDFNIKAQFKTKINRSIKGYVRAEDTGKGLFKYRVEIWRINQFIKSGLSDEFGKYTIENLPEENNLIACVWPPIDDNNYQGQFYNLKTHHDIADYLSTLDNNLENINFTLNRKFSHGIKGRVHNGIQGIEGISVDVFSNSISFGTSVMSDHDGRYTITNLDPLYSYYVSAWSDNLNALFYYYLPDDKIQGIDIPDFSEFSIEKATPVIPEYPILKHIDIIMNSKNDFLIAGYVYDKQKNKAVQGVWVNAWSDVLNCGGRALTDENGVYTINALQLVSKEDANESGYRVSVDNLSYLIQAYPEVSNIDDASLIPTGKLDVNFYLLSNSFISGTVKNINNSPLKNVHIAAWSISESATKYGETVSNEFGQYTISNLPPGDDYVISCFPDDYPSQYFDKQELIDNANVLNLRRGNQKDINFVLDKGPVIQGRIFIENKDNPAPEGIWINIWSEKSNSGGDVSTDTNGFYEITGLDLNADDYIISILNSSYLSAYYRDNEDNDIFNDTVYDWTLADGVSPQADLNSINRNIILKKGLKITGLIEYKGVAVSDIYIEASLIDGDGKWVSTSDLNQFVNYTLTGLMPGTYKISIFPEKYINSSQILVLKQDSSSVDFSLQEPLRSISGTVLGLEKDSEIRINAWSRSINFSKSIEIKGTDHAVDYTINGLKPSHDYVLEIFSRDYPYQAYDGWDSWQDADLLNVSSQNISNIVFQMKKTDDNQIISGKIIFPYNANIGDTIWVDAITHSLNLHYSVKVELEHNNQASYSITGLTPANDYLVYAWSQNYQNQYYKNSLSENNALLIDITDNKPDIFVDFTLNKGSDISGRVIDDNRFGIIGVQVEAWSEKTLSFGNAQTDEYGFYSIYGLGKSNDFIIEVRDLKHGSFFYNGDNTVRSRLFAQNVSTIDSNPQNIDVLISNTAYIKGIVTNEQGEALSDIWIDAWSFAHKAGNGVYSSKTGRYEIYGIPESRDYKITAMPDYSYASQIKQNVASGSIQINFLLKPVNNHKFCGNVSDQTDKPVSQVKVEIFSSSNPKAYGWSLTNENGNFEITGLPDAIDYKLLAWPLNDPQYATVTMKNIAVSQDLTQNIVLNASNEIKGTINDNFEKKPVFQAKITIYSQFTNYFNEVYSDKFGAYIVQNMPTADDYIISVAHTDYADIILYDKLPGKFNFLLEPAGSIFGCITEAVKGTPMEKVSIEVFSASAKGMADFCGIAKTNDKGMFIVNGLRRFHPNNQPVLDYIVTVYAKDYPPQSRGGKKIDDQVDFNLAREASFYINNHVEIPENAKQVILDVFRKNGPFVRRLLVKQDGYFSLECIHANITYQLRFIAFFNSYVISQWANVDGSGVESRNDASSFQKNNVIHFKFSNISGKYKQKSINKRPGPVRNLQSTSHTFKLINHNSRDNFKGQIPDKISNDPNITVSWDPPIDGSEDIVGYYQSFEKDSNLSFTMQNTTSIHPIKTRKITSEDLTGDDVTYYFHVAPIDKEGRLGPTTSISFRIDTIPPSNPVILVPEKTSSRNINLTLGSTGAVEMFLSNTSYKEGGTWENISKSKQWKLTKGTGEKSIYVRFKDRAGNVNNKKALTYYTEPIPSYMIQAAADENGQITPFGSVMVEKTKNQIFQILPNNGYLIDRLMVDEMAVNLLDQSYTFKQVTSPHTIKASFIRIIQKIEVISGENGQINPDGDIYVPQGDSQTFVINSNKGYEIDTFLLNNEPLLLTKNEYIIDKVMKNYSIIVSFKKVFTINVSSGENGTIEPSGNITVDKGSFQFFSINSDSGYEVERLLVDGQDEKFSGDTYSFVNIDHDHTIYASFKKKTFIITSISGSNGSIIPDGNVSVEARSNMNFSFNPDPGYEVHEILVNSNPVSISGLNYIFSDIRNNHTIIASFRVLNHPPAAKDSFIVTNEDMKFQGNFNAFDEDGDELIFELTKSPEHGIISIESENGLFTYKPDSDFNGLDFFKFKASDNIYKSDEALINITVRPINDAPYADPVSLTLNEDCAANGNLQGYDPDQDDINFVISDITKHGDVVLIDENSGAFMYTPALNYYGEDIFSYYVNDGKMISQKAFVSLSIESVNDMPYAIPAKITLLEDTPKIYTLQAFDADSDALNYSLITRTNNGKLSLIDAKNGIITYHPFSNYYGNDNFCFCVTDGKFISQPVNITLNVLPVNDIPKVINKYYEHIQNQPLDITLTSKDIDNEILSYIIKDSPEHGTLSGNIPELIYTPETDFQGKDFFTFFVKDELSVSDFGYITINVNPPSDLCILEDMTTNINISENAIILTMPEHGNISGAPPDIVYTPDLNYYGYDQFKYQINGKEMTYSILISPENDPPIIQKLLPVYAMENEPKTFNVSVFDVDGDDLIFSAGQALNGMVNSNNCQITYTSNPNFSGRDKILFQVSDNINLAEMEIDIIVEPVNLSPFAESMTLVTNEDQNLLIHLMATDPDDDPLVFEIVDSPCFGKLSGQGQELIYIPDTNYFGNDQFTYIAHDNNLYSNHAVIKISIINVNDAPTIEDSYISVPEDQGILGDIQIFDVDNDSISCSIIHQSTKGLAIILDEANCAYSYTPFANQNGKDYFIAQVSDSESNSNTAIVSITIIPVNDAPVAHNIAVKTNEDEPVFINLKSNDVDSDTVIFKIASEPQKGQILMIDSSTGLLNYSPYENIHGIDSLSFYTTDGQAESLTAQAAITILPVNDPPCAKYNTYTIDEDNSFEGSLIALDPDNDLLSFQVIKNSKKGWVEIVDSITGKFVYCPHANKNGIDTFVFSVSDGQSAPSSGQITISINPINDSPVSYLSDLIEIPENLSKNISLSASDVDNDELTLIIKDIPLHGSVKIDGFVATYMPESDYWGHDNFSFQAFDGFLSSNIVNVPIWIGVQSANIITAEDKPVDTKISSLFDIVKNPCFGSLTIDDNFYYYTPDPNFYGNDSFIYKQQQTNEEKELSIYVKSINDPPVVIISFQHTLNEDTLTKIPVMITDPDNDPSEISLSINKLPEHGLTSFSNGIIYYTPFINYFGNDSFTIKVTDGFQTTSVENIINLIIKPVNDPPIARNQEITMQEDSSISFSLSGVDIDSDDLQYFINKQPLNGRISGVPPDITYSPNPDINGLDEFSFSVSDNISESSNATVKINIQEINDPPVAIDSSILVDKNQVYQGKLQSVDIDSDILQYKIVRAALNGDVIITNPLNGNYMYICKNQDSKSDDFIFNVNDGKQNSQYAIVKVNYLLVNDLINLEINLNGDYKEFDSYLLNIIDCSLNKIVSQTTENSSSIIKTISPGTYIVQIESNNYQYFESLQINLTNNHIINTPLIKKNNGYFTLNALLIEPYQISDQYTYMILSSLSGEIIQENQADNNSFSEKLGYNDKYRLIIIAKGYEPYEYKDESGKAICPENNKNQVLIKLVKSDFDPMKPKFDICFNTYDNNFDVQIIPYNFNNMLLVNIDNYSLSGYTKYGALKYNWQNHFSFSHVLYNNPNQGDITYLIKYDIFDGSELLESSLFNFKIYASLENKMIDLPVEEAAIYDKFGAIETKIQTQSLFYPLCGTKLLIILKDSNLNEYQLNINIPPIPLDYLFIDDFDIINNGNQNNSDINYNSDTDYYDIDLSKAELKILEPGDLLKTIVTYYMTDKSGIAVNIKFKAASGKYDGANVYYNPIISSDGNRKIKSGPKIDLPLIVHDDIFQNIKNNEKLPVWISEKGDGYDGYSLKEINYSLFSNNILHLEFDHLVTFGIIQDDKASDLKNTITVDSNEGGGCFISICYNLNYLIGMLFIFMIIICICYLIRKGKICNLNNIL